ncbi:YlxR family protein [Aminithiophilus ramosus]|uniref:YlxR family protein n=2 Tax=Synergistales TaxID=649776 RepID=A0A9Q7A959_9BACT|nr:YlxR family protein [Aminithiophilus ramosus]QTX31203.1 YlxR family protein [Aminithiophilus ramosus]QVL37481.1 YlxR family protein [Synergistota bacterium]
MAEALKTRDKRSRPRTCVGCGEENPKREMFRVARDSAGGVAIDTSGRAPGRGAYLCRKRSCVESARKRNALARTLRVSLSPELYEELLALCPEEDPS